MKLLIDPAGANLFTPTIQDGGRRYYVAAAPFLAILRFDDMNLDAARGRVVDAHINWDRGTPGLAREENEGRWHTRVTIRRVLGPADTAIKALSHVLRDAPREDTQRPGGEIPTG